jgi:diguanylate cyclase (GGDEF)-like protein/PAS domain S-box-containing protein
MTQKDLKLSDIDTFDRERLLLIINITGIGVWDWKVQTGELTFNRQWAQMLGYEQEELKPRGFKAWLDNLHKDDFQRAQKALDDHFNGITQEYEAELRMRDKSGAYIWVLATGKVVEWHKGKPERMIGVHLNIDERKKNEESLLITSQLLNQSQKVAKVGGWELDLITGILFWTDETYRIHDTCPEEFNPTVDAGVGYFLPESKDRISKALDEAIQHGKGYDLELETYTTKGRKIDVRTTCVVTQENGASVRLTGIFQDISEQKATQRELEQINQNLEVANQALQRSAHYDPLTGLPNRYLLADRMQQAMVKSLRKKNYVAIAFIDVDSFKAVNDNYGHDVGDELLKKLAGELKHALRDGDTLSRIGGDEFVAVIDNLSYPHESDAVLSRMLCSVSAPVKADGHTLSVSASIGVTIFPLDSGDPDHLLRHADQAMYLAKQKGKNCYHVFDVENDVAVKHLNEKLARISMALHNEEFELYYQPKVDLRTQTVVGLEALIRWNHPERGLLFPIDFLPEIECDNLCIGVGQWVIRTALAQLHFWQTQGLDLSVSVNISPLHLQQGDFTAQLKTYLDKYPNYKANSLDLEVVESSALHDVEAVSAIIESCKALGVTFSIDDFGVGYSSLVYLKRLPVRYLKIDKSFVRDMLVDADDKAIIEGIIELAKVFKLSVIAEGIESKEHGEALLELGCHYVQGYYFAKPMPAEAFMPWLESRSTSK